MEEIIYLEPDEEITSAIDKVKQSKSNNLAIVVPRQATLLQSVVNLKLLAKEANNLGKSIAIVTADKIGRNLAAQVGLTVYDSIRDRRPVFQPPAPLPKGEEEIVIDMAKVEPEAPKPKGVAVHHFQEEGTLRPEKIKPQIATPWTHKEPKTTFQWGKLNKIIWPVLGIIILLILIGSYFVLPKVKVILKVEALDYQKDLSAQISSAKTAADLDNNIFPGNFVEKTKEKEEKFPSTGKKNLGGKASGTLTLYNYWDSNPQSLVSGAKFSSSSKTFVAKSAVTIPGTSIRGGNIVPGTATVDIEAENPGEGYNVKAGRFTIVNLTAAQQEKIYGQSSKDLTGGFSKEVTVVSQDDFNQAKDKLSKELTDEILSEVKSQNEGMEILDKAIQSGIVDIKSSANVDAEASDFTLNLNQRIKVMVFSQSLFNQFVISALEKQLAYDKMISLEPTGSIDLVKIEPKYDQQILNVDVKVSGKISSRVDLEKVKKDLLGKSRSQAESYLSNLSGVKSYEIQFSPSFWIRRIPKFSRSSNVSLEYIESVPEATSSPSVSPSLSPSSRATIEVSP